MNNHPAHTARLAAARRGQALMIQQAPAAVSRANGAGFDTAHAQDGGMVCMTPADLSRLLDQAGC